MPAGTSKVSTRSTRKQLRPKVYPVAGFVTFNWQRSAIDGRTIRDAEKKKIRLSQRDKEKLNLAQLIGNRRGFVVALVCPSDGSIVETHTGHDLPDGVLARCPMIGCGKTWLQDAD
jgi:hypothetical protein